MNRSTRRKLDKEARRKFTPEQYNDFRSDVQFTYIKDEVDKMAQKALSDMVEILPIVLRENRISEQRVDKILKDFSKKFREKYKEVFTDEGLPEQGRA